MLIDMHMHEKTFSSDSHLALDDMVFRARELGLDGICITDHDSNGLTKYAAEYSKVQNFPIFVGYEYLTDRGDILVFGVDRVPNKMKMPLDNLLLFVHQNDGIAIPAHPYRKNNRGLEDHLWTAKYIQGIEVLNGSTSMDLNFKAYEVARSRGLHITGASDCHVYNRIGKYATHVPDGIESVADLVAAFNNSGSEIYPVKHNGSLYQREIFSDFLIEMSK